MVPRAASRRALDTARVIVGMLAAAWAIGRAEAVDTATVVSTGSWPGGIVVEYAAPVDAGVDAADAVVDLAPDRWRQRPAPRGSSMVALVLRPTANEASRLAMMEFVAEFVGRRGADSVALYRWGASLELLRDAGEYDGQEVIGALALAARPDPGETPAAAARVGEALDAFAARDFGAAVGRHVVVLGEADDGERIGLSGVPLTRVDISVGGDPRRRAIAAAAEIDVVAASYRRLAACLPVGEDLLRFTVAGGDIAARRPDEVMVGQQSACDLDAMLEGRRRYPDVLRIDFGSRQRSLYRQRVAAESKGDFQGSLLLEEGGSPYPATLHLRGQGSLGCDRKSYTVRLSPSVGWHLMPGSIASDYYLLSLCGDDWNLRYFTAGRLWSAVGLFPFHFRFVELVVDGEYLGTYLLIEKAVEAILARFDQVRVVLRRDSSERNTFTRSEWSLESESIANGDFVNAFLGLDRLDGEAFVERLERVLDVDGYLTHLAMATILFNGDYADELWMVQRPWLGDDGSRTTRYRILLWDGEEIFHSCHLRGRYVVEDPRGIHYCAEGDLDLAILGNPLFYRRFVDRVVELLDGALDQRSITAAFGATLDALDDILGRSPPTLDGRAATDPTGFRDSPELTRARLRALTARMLGQSGDRRRQLLERIDAYRAEATAAPL